MTKLSKQQFISAFRRDKTVKAKAQRDADAYEMDRFAQINHRCRNITVKGARQRRYNYE
ncbi:hypothetical protein [Oxobacter pfennigii]|uniref:hypothetical protein n=1 Tax=Oxobacter pfennigii TaxID=36849 RepID=UPI0013649C31|nr:hypothetical protein [Oxobacter pfennigii]